MPRFTKEEIDTIKKFLQYRGSLWLEYNKGGPWDLMGSIDPKTLELIRMGFLTGVWCCLLDLNEEDKD